MKSLYFCFFFFCVYVFYPLLTLFTHSEFSVPGFRHKSSVWGISSPHSSFELQVILQACPLRSSPQPLTSRIQSSPSQFLAIEPPVRPSFPPHRSHNLGWVRIKPKYVVTESKNIATKIALTVWFIVKKERKRE